VSINKLEIENITKVFPGTVALKDFSARFEGGKVHALIGKNGSGKSTLVKICSGALQPTSGTIKVDGKTVTMRVPTDAFAVGLAVVYQELSLIPEITVVENILLGRLPRMKGVRRLSIDWAAAYVEAGEILTSVGADIPLKAKVKSLSIGQQQVVEIAKAMSFHPSVLILDEPTSALARHETESLFRVIRTLKEKGVAILYVTHRLHELYAIADTVTVVRDGKYVGSIEMEKATPQIIVDMMFGEAIQKKRPMNLGYNPQVVLEVKNLARGMHFKDIGFVLHKGEILGIAGMLGSGRTELLRCIFVIDSFDPGGEILVDGVSVRKPTPILMKRLGVAMTPENRKKEGIIETLSVHANLCLASMKSIARRHIITQAREKPFVDGPVEKLGIKVSDTGNLISSLSGGNQQKVVVGNWLNTVPKIILFDEPSRGIDVFAKQQIFQIMWDLSNDGISSIFVSTELEELIEVCHRILVMRNGQIFNEVKSDEVTIDQLYAICMEG
jgi:ABC-type sugar transport system ATPase subunit